MAYILFFYVYEAPELRLYVLHEDQHHMGLLQARGDIVVLVHLLMDQDILKMMKKIDLNTKLTQ